MKKFLRIFMAAGLTAIVAATLPSCKDNVTPEPGTDDTNNTNFPTPVDHSDLQTKYPIAWTPYTVEKGSSGISLEVTSVEMDDFTFVARPGSGVGAYKLCAFPLSIIYNYLLEADLLGNANGIDAFLRSYIHERSSAGFEGYYGGSDITYTIEGTDNNDKEFVWSEAGYNYVPLVVPDAEYLLVALAYLDAACERQADLSLCYIRTASHTPDGTPLVEAAHEADFNSVKLKYLQGNEQAAGFYEFTSDAAAIEEYIAEFGDKLYVDFIRHSIIGPANEFSSDIFDTLPFTPEQAELALSTAVAVDKYGMPGELQTWKLTALKVPDEVEQASATLTVDENHVGTMIFWMNAHMSAATHSIGIRHMTVAEAETYKNDAAARATLGADLRDNGWQIQNPNFKFDRETLKVTGQEGDAPAYRIDLVDIKENTEYVVAYAPSNYFKQVPDVYFTEPFKTDARITDQPGQCAGEVKVEFENPSPIGFTIKFTYDLDDVAVYHWQIVSPTESGQADMNGNHQIPGFVDSESPLDYASTTREQWMKYFYEARDTYNNPLCNSWFFNWDDLATAGNNGSTVQNADGTYTDSWTFADMIPDKTYEVICVTEDWNGYVSEHRLYKCTTVTLNPGPNPEAKITSQVNTGGGFTATIEPVQDCGRLLVMEATTSSQLGTTWSPAQLVSGSLKGTLNGNPTSLESAIKSACIGSGLTYYTTTSWIYTGSTPCILICVPEGQDADGTPCYGEAEYLVYDGKTTISTDVRDYL